VTPGNYHDPEDPIIGNNEGRGALPDWLAYGYVTPNYSAPLSRPIEYSQNDFSLIQVAKALAPEDYEKYLHRSA
jgi:putative alpha-1,2-mannosidase